MNFDDINRELRELCEQNCDEPVPDCLDLDLDAELVAAIEECMLEEELSALNGTAAPIDMTGWTVVRTTISTPKSRAPSLLTDTCDGSHPPRMEYFRRFSNAPTNAEELGAWASIGVTGSVLCEWADVYPIGDPVVFTVPKCLRDRGEFCTDVPRKHSAGPNPCGEVKLLSSRPCTLNHVTLDIDLTRSLKSITLSDIGVGPKKHKILSSR